MLKIKITDRLLLKDNISERFPVATAEQLNAAATAIILRDYRKSCGYYSRGAELRDKNGALLGTIDIQDSGLVAEEVQFSDNYLVSKE